MSLTTNPFHPVTGELLASHRDAYLRGDLSGHNADLVDAYLKANPAKGDETMLRFHALREKGHDVRPVGWIQNQFQLMRTEPVRFRQRAASILVVGALLSGAVLASNNLPTETTAGDLPVVASATATGAEMLVVAEGAAAKKMSILNGRILGENGQPLVGATVLDKASGRGVTTNAQGAYTIAVPANQLSQLQYGYGGYSEEVVQVKGRGVQNVTLLPRTDKPAKAKKSHWWSF